MEDLVQVQIQKLVVLSHIPVFPAFWHMKVQKLASHAAPIGEPGVAVEDIFMLFGEKLDLVINFSLK